ncbi:adaptin [Thecamonas trahens ATCC 50062]|uniref:Adaptin n=1 Tax=Thecamonas trahens ATCC 50062 TaxID=461836 RepID=A0A0L0DAI5_THETB|nr:adaptin [Thecamonas trahens ATCC 50062]KNC49081.1 adaptin [Thecamonas trahens ATCC 50062]|eukprot:XP_013758112.1 adaptin [Thecamonas trahens ATCC 50062]
MSVLSEANKLKQQLNMCLDSKDAELRLTTIRKVIQNMTLGMDMSLLFTEMIKAAVTRDLAQKKLVYLYLASYAESHPDVALLAVNTLQRNAADVDPMVRGLALRTLCSLRLANLAEYTIPVLANALGDPSPYVRKTAVVGVVKIAAVAPNAVAAAGLLDTVRLMVQDVSPAVVFNAVMALHEIAAPQGGIALTEKLVLYVFNRLREFDDWAQAALITLCQDFVPSSDEQRYALMDVLDARLQNLNSGVVLAAISMFLRLTQDVPEMHAQVLARVKAPLITTLSRASPEMAYSVLQHCRLLADRAPAVFADEYTSFFVLYSDPPYVVELKLALLEQIVTPDNCSAIIAELAEYVRDVNPATATRALRVLGSVGLALVPAAKYVLRELFSFLDSTTPYVVDGAVVVMKDLVRKYSDLAPHLLDRIPAILPRVADPGARTVLIWMLGEHGEGLERAPYMLEALVADFESEDSPAVKLQMLTSCMQLFLKRPGEMQPILGQLLAVATADNSVADVHDRALFYYRLLEEGPDAAREVVMAPKLFVETFAESEHPELVDTLFDEFNTLSVVYRAPSETFIHQRAPYVLGKTRFGGDPAAFDSDTDSDDGGFVAPAVDSGAPPGGSSPVAEALAPAESAPVRGDLLSLDLGATPVSSAGPAANPPNLGIESELTGAANLTQGRFQELWQAFGRGEEVEFPIQAALSMEQVENTLGAFRIVCMASGSVEPHLAKFFFYGQTLSGDYILMQLVIDTAAMSGSAVVKTRSPILTKFVSTVVNVLSAASMRAASAGTPAAAAAASLI